MKLHCTSEIILSPKFISKLTLIYSEWLTLVMADCPHTIGVEFGTRIIEVETLFGFQVCDAKCVSGVGAEDKATDLGHCWAREVCFNLHI